MLRDSDNPEKSWEDLEAELLPHRPFYAPAKLKLKKTFMLSDDVLSIK